MGWKNLRNGTGNNMKNLGNKSQIVLALAKISGVGNAKINKLYNTIIKDSSDLDDICKRISIELKSEDIYSEDIINQVHKDISYAEQNGIKIITIADEDFPAITSPDVPNGDKPTILYYIGDIALLNNKEKNVSIIGTRTPDAFGQRACEIVTRSVINMGFVIVSGLANGCDSIAHETTVQAGARTIAILPTPPNNTKINKELAQDILNKGGLLVSEYLYPDRSQMEYSANCAKRDKLIAMYCSTLILISGGVKSGSAIAVEHAKKYKTNIGVVKPKGQFDPDKFSLNVTLLCGSRDSTTSISIDEQGMHLDL